MCDWMNECTMEQLCWQRRDLGHRSPSRNVPTRTSSVNTISGADNTDNLSTLSMVFIMVGVVKGVFICFAFMAVCYRYCVAICAAARSEALTVLCITTCRPNSKPYLLSLCDEVVFLCLSCTSVYLYMIVLLLWSYLQHMYMLYSHWFAAPTFRDRFSAHSTPDSLSHVILSCLTFLA